MITKQMHVTPKGAAQVICGVIQLESEVLMSIITQMMDDKIVDFLKGNETHIEIYDMLSRAGIIKYGDTDIPRCKRCSKDFFDETHLIEKAIRIDYVPGRGERVTPYGFRCIERIKITEGAV
ncbi:MAG: hypothetical protein GY794_15495 [bacterium]|nr:hypothetical protein [bacterium]